MDNELDITKMNLSWTNLYQWFGQHRNTILLSFVISAVIWGIAVEIGHPYTLPVVPTGGKLVTIGPVQTYQMVLQDRVLTLTRDRSGFVSIAFALFCYITVFFPVHTYLAYRREMLKKHSHRAIERPRSFPLTLLIPYAFLTIFWLSFIYFFDYQTWWVVTQPRVFVLNPVGNQVSINGDPFVRMTDIAHFYGLRHPGRYKVREWGAVLKDGEQIPFEDDLWVSNDVDSDTAVETSLITYLNLYLSEQVPGTERATDSSLKK